MRGNPAEEALVGHWQVTRPARPAPGIIELGPPSPSPPVDSGSPSDYIPLVRAVPWGRACVLRTRAPATRGCRPGDGKRRACSGPESSKDQPMTKRVEAKHKLDRRMGQNIWGRPKSPINRREYGPGQHGQRRKGKMSDFGTQLRAKQKLKG